MNPAEVPVRGRHRCAVGPIVRILLAGLVASSAAVVAHAYVPAVGAGSGTAGTATLGAITLSPASVTDALYPGDTATVAVTAQNSDNAEVRISTLALDTSQGTGGFARATGSASCTLSAFSFTAQNNSGDGWTLPPNSSLSISMPDAVAASTSSVSACQTATLTVYLKAS